MKLHDLGEVGQEIGEAVIAGIQMVLVFHVLFQQLIVQGSSSFFEAIVIILATIEINGELLQGGGILPGEVKGVVGVPVSNGDRISENVGQHFPERRARPGGEIQLSGRLGNQRSALGTDGGKHFRMAEGETQRTVSPHRDSGDRSIVAAFADAVFPFDERDKLLQKKIAVTNRTVSGVDVETFSAFGSNNEKIAEFMLLAKIVEHRPAAAVEERFLVIAQAVEEIEHWIVLGRFVVCARIVAGWKVDAVMDRVLENAAVQSVAFDATLSAH